MYEYDEMYEENNNIEENQPPEDLYEYQPQYHMVKEYYHNENPSGYGKTRIITQNYEPSRNNVKKRMESYYNYYTESNIPFNEKRQKIESITNKRFNTPNRSNNSYKFMSTRSNYNYNLRDEYSNPLNNRLNTRVNIKKKVYKGSQTPQPYSVNISRNEDNEEYLDNYQFHETKNIKDKGFKKYDSITHITGYSNLIPLHRMKNIYGNNYKYNYKEENKCSSNCNYGLEDEEPKIKSAIKKVQELQRGKREYDEFMRKLNSNSEQNYRLEKIKEERLKQEKMRQEQLRQEMLRKKEEEIMREKIRQERLRQEEEMRLEKIRQEKIRHEEEMRLKKIRQEKMRQEEEMRLEKIRQEKIREERERREEEMRLEKIRREELREVKLRQNRIKQEKMREDKLKQEKIRQEKLKQEKINQEKIKQEKLRQEQLRQQKLKEEKLRQEKLKQEKIKKENIRNERSESIKERFKAHTGKYTYKQNIEEDINKYRNNTNYNNEKGNISKREIIHKNSKTKTEKVSKLTKFPIQNNISSLSYNRNYSYQNIKNSNSTKNNNNTNKVLEFKYLNNNKKNSKDQYNTSYTAKTTKTTTTTSIISDKGKTNSYNRRNDKSANEDKKYISSKTNYTTKNYKPNLSINTNTNTNSTTNEIISLLKIQKNSSKINYPNINEKPENKVKKKISNAKSAINVFHKNRREYDNEYYNREEELYERRQRGEANNNIYQLPEKNVEEIISTVTMKKKNLGDNYKFHESKNLHQPNLTSFTRHRRINQRTIYGNETHETREVKTYKVRPQYNEYENNTQKYIEYNKMPYEERGYARDEVNYGQRNYGDDGEEQEFEGDEGEYEDDVEEKYIEEEEAYYH